MSDIEQLRTGATAILFVALLAGVGVIVLGEFQTNEERNQTVVNESWNITHTNTGTWLTLAYNNTAPYWLELINTSVSFANGTHRYAGTSGANFIVDPVVGRVQVVRAGQINASINASNPASGVLWNVSYTWVRGSAARDTFGEGVLGVQEITSWLDIIALALVLGVVVAFVMKAIYDRNLPRQGY